LATLSGAPKAITASIAAAVLIAACGDDDGDRSSVQLPSGCAEVEAPAPKDLQLSRPSKLLRGPATAEVETSCGSFEIALDTARAPRTTSSFAYLARNGAYDGTAIHRIEPGFVIQGGDPKGDGTGGPGYFIDEPPPNVSYTRGTVAMAKTAVEPPGRSGSQFFVVLAADAGLTPDYALVGRVTSGFDVVERIAQLGTPGGTPRVPVTIERITVGSG
jgi:peptidyl-prolyl cis-trans isomerase B (cyclophilin B)